MRSGMGEVWPRDLMALCVLLVVISFIDAEHMIIPMNFVCAGLVIGLIAGVVAPALVVMGSPVPAMPSWAGGAQALLGIVVGWGVLALVVVIGKYFFGERRMKFDDQAATWSLREPENDEEELRFVVGEEELDWSEVFCRKKDNPLSPPSDPVQRRLQSPPAKSKFLAVQSQQRNGQNAKNTPAKAHSRLRRLVRNDLTNFHPLLRRISQLELPVHRQYRLPISVKGLSILTRNSVDCGKR
jgi:hypothetical protein